MTQPKAGVKPGNNQYKLNTVTPGCAEAQLGDRIAELEAKINALLAHIDAAGAAAIAASAAVDLGTTNADTYGVTPIDQTVPGPA